MQAFGRFLGEIIPLGFYFARKLAEFPYRVFPDFPLKVENQGIIMVPRKGLEPPRCYSLVPETSASTNSATWANFRELRILY
jgi:hypothetical protein